MSIDVVAEDVPLCLCQQILPLHKLIEELCDVRRKFPLLQPLVSGSGIEKLRQFIYLRDSGRQTLFRQFFLGIPKSLEEAARLDGCGNTRFFFHIVLPLSGAITAILVLYYGQGHWNSYFSALLYINDREKWPLQLELRNILLLNTNTMTKEFITEEMRKEQARREALANMMKYSLIIISSIPMLIVYPFVQKHFVKGVMIGSVKG